MNTHTYDFRVAGVTFEGRQGVLARLFARQPDGGHTVELIREPSNEHDPNAIRVYLDSIHVGYVPAPAAKSLAPWLDEGYRYKIVGARIYRDGKRYSVGIKDLQLIDKGVV